MLFLGPLIFGIFPLIYFVLLIYLQWNFGYWKNRRVNGPKPLLWHGTFPKSCKGRCNLLEELDEIYGNFKSSEKYIGVFNRRTPRLFILDPFLAKQILTTYFTNFHDNESSKWSSKRLDRLRLMSPFTSTGEIWRERRLELTPVLTASRLRLVHGNMGTSSKKLTGYISGHLKEAINAKELINRYTADFMASFIWGIQQHTDAFAEDDAISDLHRMGCKMIEQSLRCVGYYGRTGNFPWIRKLFPQRFFPKISDEFFQQLTVYALKMRAAIGASSPMEESTDVINHLLQLRDKKHLNDVQIAGHTTTLMIDGFETGAIVTAHLLLLLARNPRAQQKLRNELLREVEVPVADTSLLQLKREFSSISFLETLRLFPPLSLFSKICTKEFTLETKNGSKFHFDLDSGVYISTYSFHRDENFYENPHEFWPERFGRDMGGVKRYQDMGVFLPFGDGPRICPGLKLGTAIVKLATASIVQNFHIKPSGKSRLDNKIAADSFLLSLDGVIELIFEEIKS